MWVWVRGCIHNWADLTKMLKATLLAFYVSYVATLTMAQQAGCSGPPTESQVATLIASNINGPQGTATITLQMSPAGFMSRVVCLSSSGERNQYRFVSIVAYYSENGETPQYGQFEFECVSSVWSATSPILDQTSYNRHTLMANSTAINAANRTDCAYCLNSGFMSPPRYTDTVNHCSACSGCAQPLCYIMDTSLPTNFTSDCCDYYENISGSITCTNECPPLSYPDGNRICVPCSLTCQNGGTLRSDSCACNCTAVSTGSDCSGCLCQNGGTCSGDTCTCPPGYSGPLCSTCILTCPAGYYLNSSTCSCVPVCSVVCQNGGTCSGGACTCPPGYSGPLCSTCILTCPAGYYLNYSTCSCGVTAKAAVSGGGCGGACIGVIIGAILGAIFGAILVVVIVVVIVGVCIHVGMKSSAVAPSAVPSAGQNGVAKDSQNPRSIVKNIV